MALVAPFWIISSIAFVIRLLIGSSVFVSSFRMGPAGALLAIELINGSNSSADMAADSDEVAEWSASVT